MEAHNSQEKAPRPKRSRRKRAAKPALAEGTVTSAAADSSVEPEAIAQTELVAAPVLLENEGATATLAEIIEAAPVTEAPPDPETAPEALELVSAPASSATLEVEQDEAVQEPLAVVEVQEEIRVSVEAEYVEPVILEELVIEAGAEYIEPPGLAGAEYAEPSVLEEPVVVILAVGEREALTEDDEATLERGEDEPLLGSLDGAEADISAELSAELRAALNSALKGSRRNAIVADDGYIEVIEAGGLWQLLDDRVEALESREWSGYTNLWDVLEERIDPNRYKPRRRLDYEIVEEPTKGDSTNPPARPVYYLRVVSVRAYLKVGEPQLFVWNLLDGEHTVRDIMFAYKKKYNKMAIGVIMQALGIFRGCGMLEEPKDSLFDRLSRSLDWVSNNKFSPYIFLKRLKFSFKRLDPKVDWIYRHGGWLLFKPVVTIPILLITLFGMGLMLYTLWQGGPLMAQLGETGGLAYVLISYATILPLIVVHELMHALTVKHYKRDVLGGGFMLLRGMPSMYIDTTDMWMDRNKWHRIKVSLNGPLANYCASALLTMAVWVLPLSLFSVFLFALAINNALNATLNLLPLIELDGYYALLDLLEETALRGKSMKFVRQDFRKRWTKCYKFTRREWLYTIFGLLCYVFTASLLAGIAYVVLSIVIGNIVLLSIFGAISLLITLYSVRHLIFKKPNNLLEGQTVAAQALPAGQAVQVPASKFKQTNAEDKDKEVSE